MRMYSSSFLWVKKFWTVVLKWMQDKEEHEEGYKNVFYSWIFNKLCSQA